MKTHIIVEGRWDKEVLERLLADLPRSAERKIEAANGKDAARPIVRKHLLRVGEPTAFVFDTDTTDRSKVRDQIEAFEDYFRWGAPRARFEMFPMIPALEILFFDRPSTLERHMKKPLDVSMRKAGVHAPKQVLEDLLPALGAESLDDFVRSLTAADLNDLREQEIIKKLRRFVEGASE
jgi:hypothetical protein